MGILTEKQRCHLTLLEELPARIMSGGRKYKFVKLQCECGNIVEKVASSYKRGAYKFCGKDCPKKNDKYLQYIGKTYGRLTIQQFLGVKDNNATVWVDCLCGNSEESKLSALLNGHKSTCTNCSNRKFLPDGTQFDLLTIKKSFFDTEKGQTMVTCKCECGNVKTTPMSYLTRKKKHEDYIHSCGCFYKKNLVGSKFGRLTIVKEAERLQKEYKGSKISRRRWICHCACGKQNVIAVQSELEAGKKKSCGCLLSAEERGKRVRGEKNPMYGIKGELSPTWDPERTHEQRKKERKDHKYYNWRKSVYERDGFRCKCCGKKSTGDIVAHHMFNYKDFPLLRYETSNGITLCTKCHTSFHSIYGKSKNTETQFIEFINKYFPRDKRMTMEDVIKERNVPINDFKKVKPYQVTFPNGKVERFYTYEEMKEKHGIPVCSALQSVKYSKLYQTRKIILKKKDIVLHTFASYSEAARHFGCSNLIIKQHIEKHDYQSKMYPHLRQYDYEELFETIKIERIV